MASGIEAFSLLAKLILDSSEYDAGLSKAHATAKKVGGAIGGAFKTTAKIAGAGIVATTTAVAGLVTASTKAYADYEQLVGGIETLFGAQGMSLQEYADSVGKSTSEVAGEYNKLQEAQALALENADNAYKTAGLSANEYMETVTGMAAALNSSLGGDTVESAKKADMAITDMADNANKMGTSMEAIQNAYSGFAKQNYTMLDNLKLGYGGTKEEMQRLLADAEAISGVHFDVSSYADIVDAIHVVQDEMGITGTTAKEATETISGSLAMTKSAWQNLVTGLTNPDADIGQLISNLVESGKAALNNLIPAISQSLTGIVDLVQGLIPVISEQLPSLIEEVLPMLVDTGITLFQGLVEALPTFVQVLIDQLPTVMNGIINAVITLLPMIIELGGQFIMSLLDGMVEILPTMLPQIIDVIMQIVNMFTNVDNLMKFLDAAVAIIQEIALGLVEALPELIPAVINVILAIVEALTEPTNLMTLLDAALSIMIAIADGLIQAIPVILERLPFIILNIVQTLIMLAPQLLKSGAELISKLAMGLLQARVKVVQAIINIFNKLRDTFHERIERAKDWGKDLIQNFIDGIKAKWEALKQTVSDVAQSVKDFLGFSEPKKGPLSNFHTYAPDMMDLFMQGIKENEEKLRGTISRTFDFGDVIKAQDITLGTDSNADVTSMLEQIASYLPQLANNQIVLDTGILVGQTAPKMDVALGQLMTNRARSV